VTAIGAKHTAVPRLWAKQGLAGLAFVKPLASVGGHRFFLAVSALGTGERRLKHDFTHVPTPFLVVDGKAASAAALAIACLAILLALNDIVAAVLAITLAHDPSPRVPSLVRDCENSRRCVTEPQPLAVRSGRDGAQTKRQ